MYQRNREHLHRKLQQAFIEEQKKRERQQALYSGRALPVERETTRHRVRAVALMMTFWWSRSTTVSGFAAVPYMREPR